MKNIEIDEELYQYIVSNTQSIGESASSILRRLLSVKEEITVEHNVTNEENLQCNDDKLIIEESSDVDIKTINTESICDTEILVEEQQEVTNTDSDKMLTAGSFYDYINKEELAVQRGAVGRFLLILAALYRVHSQDFLNVCDIRGRDRLYFANNEAVLNASGSSTKPRQIPDSPYWVITNSNTTRKKMMLTEVAISLGYSAGEAEEIRDLL